MGCEGPRFDALRNAIYHASRKAFYDRWNRIFSFVIIVAGAAAIGDIGIATPSTLAAVATAAAALQLVFDFGGKSCKHDYLQRRYYELIADITSNPDDAEHERRWTAALERLYADEPPPMRALDAVSYNAACGSLGKPDSDRLKVGFWHNLFRQWYSYPDTNFAPDASVKSASPSA